MEQIVIKRSVLRDASIQIAAGGTSGFTEICIMHPLDLVKTRLQLQSVPKKSVNRNDMKHYSGIFDCLRKMYLSEGPLSFWKGVIPPILGETPKRAVKFASFEQYKRVFMFGSKDATAMTFFLSGLCAGFTEAIVTNPFEAVKVNMQSNQKRGVETPNTWQVTREIIQTQGFGRDGLYKGFTATLMRNGVFNSFYLGFYNSVKGYFPIYEENYKELVKKITLGFISGVCASCLNIPFDVGKSRIQGPQPVHGQVKYRNIFPTIVTIYKEEGLGALYKGLLPKIMRLGPGGAIMLVVYDYMLEVYSANFG